MPTASDGLIGGPRTSGNFVVLSLALLFVVGVAAYLGNTVSNSVSSYDDGTRFGVAGAGPTTTIDTDVRASQVKHARSGAKRRAISAQPKVVSTTGSSIPLSGPGLWVKPTGVEPNG